MHDWHLPDRVLKIERRPLILGIVNVTPDSFSDGGRYFSRADAVAFGLQLVEQGADLLDVGGESTRPGAAPVPLEEELRRVVPVVEALARGTRVPLSVDTSKARVAQACLEAGAQIVNDVTALAGDSAMPEVVVRARAGVILMHMQGNPLTMQLAPHYEDVVADVAGFFAERLRTADTIGIARERIALDPGLGFGKTLEHNVTLLARLNEFQRLGRPVCLGVSRKGFLGQMVGGRPVAGRLAGALAVLGFALARQALQIVRVHDVQETRDFLTVWNALEETFI